MTVLILSIVFAVLFMIVASLMIFVIGPVMLMQPHRRTIDYYRQHTTLLHPSDAGLRAEELTLRTAEGIPLSCWLIPAQPPGRGTVVLLHGIGECKIAGLPLARRLHAAGFHVFLYDARRHGDSGGRFCTYGFYEKHDAGSLITALCSRPDLRVGAIGLHGVSMGAAVAIQVAAADRRVAAVVAESGFATLRRVMDDYQKRMIKLPWHYLRNIVIKRSEHMAHFKANAVSPLDAVRAVRIPLLLIHGTDDDRIPPASAHLLFAQANEPKELWLLPGAQHHNVAEVGGEEYYRRVVGFFAAHLR